MNKYMKKYLQPLAYEGKQNQTVKYHLILVMQSKYIICLNKNFNTKLISLK